MITLGEVVVADPLAGPDVGISGTGEIAMNMIPEGSSLTVPGVDTLIDRDADMPVNMVPEGAQISPSGAENIGIQEEGAGIDTAREESVTIPSAEQTVLPESVSFPPRGAGQSPGIFTKTPPNKLLLYGAALLVIIITISSLALVGRSEGWWNRRKPPS
ncbi:hypothetical protein J2741_000876 [Methanolinea mesophila]|uniref:hypothetical protein n=1 Tax=Methanolinea mesophila TaxID=547055 RepID=UPI001AE192FF|nr:hypothetical protein [Methanolinea mesophila]MBP1928329.1 hypothetical protein [Methanolinea mesophila]